MYPVKKPTTREDIFWVAALLDGEGCFTNRTSKYAYPRIICGMSDHDVIYRLAEIVGGTPFLKQPAGKAKKPTFKPILNLEIGSGRAVGLMMTIYQFMSARRQAKIREILQAWRDKEKWYPKACRHGHIYEEGSFEMTSLTRRGKVIPYRSCNICRKARAADYATRYKDKPWRNPKKPKKITCRSVASQSPDAPAPHLAYQH